MLKVLDSDSKFQSRWKRRCWIVKSELNAVSFMSTSEGVIAGRTIHRLPEKPFDWKALFSMSGVP